MTRVFVSVSMTLDGYAAPAGEGLALEPDDPRFGAWMEQWMKLQRWIAEQRSFRQRLQLGEDGETGPDDDLVNETFERIGVTIIGKRMFDGGEKYWPEEAPFRHPVFVLTHQRRSPWVRPGGTTFTFVNDGPEAALARAREAARAKDIRIGGGANTIVQFLNAGLVDELHIALAPVLFGAGVPMFGGIDRAKVSLEVERARASKHATHLWYALSKPRTVVSSASQ
jgi:dihydrofolate reductase